MSNDIRDILSRLTALEGKLTPVSVKHGLNKQQDSVPQLPALFKPKDISPTLSKKPYQKHPMDGWLVGEEEETEKESAKRISSLISKLNKVDKDADVDLVTFDVYGSAPKPVVKATTITCIKGKLTKKVTAVNPKCPTGYKQTAKVLISK